MVEKENKKWASGIPVYEGVIIIFCFVPFGFSCFVCSITFNQGGVGNGIGIPDCVVQIISFVLKETRQLSKFCIAVIFYLKDKVWSIIHLYLVDVHTIDQGFFFQFLDPNSNGFFHLTQPNFVANSAKFCFQLPILANLSWIFN